MPPGEELWQFVVSFIEKNELDKCLLNEVPKKWEKYGDFVLFDERTFPSDVWKKQDSTFWLKISQILKCKRIGVKNKIKNDGYRTPNVTILLGEDPWIVHKDNSIIYTWNVEKSMFSAGNACERHRIAEFDCQNEVVVDLFAGIGYFTLPFLVHSKADHVHACEWNPVAVEALKRNLSLNNVENRCTIYEGDNSENCPKKIGNRINLGLIPSSEKYWKIAVEALVDDGGILHVHENVETKKTEVKCEDCIVLHSQMQSDSFSKNLYMNSDERLVKEGNVSIMWKHKQWLLKCVHILHSLTDILLGLYGNKVWCCSLEDINFVKSYAPHVHHLVYDIKIENKTCK